MDGLKWTTLLKWMIWGYHYFWKHPYNIYIYIYQPLNKSGVNQILVTSPGVMRIEWKNPVATAKLSDAQGVDGLM